MKVATSVISHELKYAEGSFAHLTLRRTAKRYLMATKDFMAHNDGELYILDEAYGEPSNKLKDLSILW